MQRLVFFALRPLALVFAVVAALLASAPAAHAQQPVTPPLTTKRLERLLRVYVAPTPAEEAAIDELHETYLARFRAEIKPELESLPGLFGGALPAREDFENALRELDRVHAKIAEIEKGFFDEATALLAEERRAGMQRVRESRERQRNVTGPSSHVFQNVDGRGVFVDLADLLARDEFIREVPEAARKDFDAFLLAQEQRLLAQSRSFASECRKAHEQWYEAIVEQNQLAMQATEAHLDAAEAGAMGGEAAAAAEEALALARSRLVELPKQRAEENARNASRAVRLNAEANRAAVLQLATILPELSVHRLRAVVAHRSTRTMDLQAALGETALLRGFHGDLPALLAMLRRHPGITAEMREAFDPIELAWYREVADNLEKAAKLSYETNLGQYFVDSMRDPGSVDPAVKAAVATLAEEAREADQRAYRAIAAIIGTEKSESVFARQQTVVGAVGAESAGPVTLMPNLAGGLADGAAAAPVVEIDTIGGAVYFTSLPAAWTAAKIARTLEPLGVSEPSLAVIESVVEDWTAREWDPKVRSLGTELSAVTKSMWVPRADGRFQFDRERTKQACELRLRFVDASFAAEAVLWQELANALGLGMDSAEVLLLRLERVRFLAGSSSSMFNRENPPPSAILARADVSPEAARAFIDGSRDAWVALAEKLPAGVRSMVEASNRLQLAATPQAAGEFYYAEESLPARESASAVLMHRVARKYGALCDDAATNASESAEVSAALRRAYLSLARPDLYNPSDSANAALDAALVLEGITAEQLARLEALKAEYEAVFDSLSERIVIGPANLDLAERGSQQGMEAIAAFEGKLLLQRTEVTQKARSDARRILGDELAARVRGLGPADADAASNPTQMPFGGIRDDD
jgi:hypothetical protein